MPIVLPLITKPLLILGVRLMDEDTLRLYWNRRIIGKCPFCGTVPRLEDFKNTLSVREFNISGLCQACQDKMFPLYEVQEGYGVN